MINQNTEILNEKLMKKIKELNRKWMEEYNEFDMWEEYLKYLIFEARKLAQIYMVDYHYIETICLLYKIDELYKNNYEDFLVNETMTSIGYSEDYIYQTNNILKELKTKKIESIESKIIDEANSIVHLDNIAMVFRSAFVRKKLNLKEGKIWAKNKIKKEYNSLPEKIQKLEKTKYENILKVVFNETGHMKDRDQIEYDNWLDEYKSIIDTAESPIIDLGCGSGNDVLYLINKGKKVIACDILEDVIENIEKNFPEVDETLCFDMRKKFPIKSDSTEVIISDLSLHFFYENDTRNIVNEMKRVLKKDGTLILRVNDIENFEIKRSKLEEVEHNLFKTKDGRLKRGFSKEDIYNFFDEWNVQSISENLMARYDKPKKCLIATISKGE